MIRGEPGAKSLVFRLVSNHSDFLSYSYLVYGIREEEFKKVIQVSDFFIILVIFMYIYDKLLKFYK